MNDENNNLDNLIDGALSSYTPSAERPGLEQRILASVAAASRPRLSSWRPLWALTAALALVAIIIIPLAIKSTRPTIAVLSPPTLTVHSSQAAPSSTSVPQQHTLAAHLRPAAMHPVTLKVAIKSRFPFIAPLAIAPIETQPITIAPIQIEALN